MSKHLLVAAGLLWSATAAADVRVDDAYVVSGFPPVVRLSGLGSGETIRVHLFRMYARWETADPAKRTGWRQVPQPLHAWVDARAGRRGRLDLARAVPLAGTYRGADAYGLSWSGRKPGDRALSPAVVADFNLGSIEQGASRLVVTRGSQVVAQALLRISAPAGLRTVELAEGPLNGFFAVPDSGRSHPAVILLHGSEGGDRDAAREIAQRFAGQGFAAFALNYFAWDLKNIVGVPNEHVNQPIELLEQVRTWLAAQPQVAAGRIGAYSHSKGAEYAAAAAVYLPWIKVAACVPSNSVWQGYGIGDARNRPQPGRVSPAQLSSWSWQGTPLPYIALPVTDDRSVFFNNTAYYEARRAVDPAVAQAARIPVERSRAHFLWLGAGRDETWASGNMAARNDRVLREAGAGSRSTLYLYRRTGHAICGDGTYPTRLWANDSPDPRGPDLDADGRVTVDAWQRTVTFFRRAL